MLRGFAPPRIHVNKMKFHRFSRERSGDSKKRGKTRTTRGEKLSRSIREKSTAMPSKNFSLKDVSIVFDFVLSQPLFTVDGT
jgi:hypothetical protein